MAEKDIQTPFSALLESVDGLTDEFKEKAPQLFEEAVAQRVAEETAKFEAKLAEEVNNAKKITLDESAKAFGEQIDALTAKNVELEEALKVQAEEAEEKLHTLTENVHELAKDMTKTAMAELEQQVAGWADYCADEFIRNHQTELVQAEEVKIAHGFMNSIKAMMESFNMAQVEGAQALKDEIKALEEENQNVYHELSESIARANTLEAKMESMKTQAFVESLKEGMTDTDKDRFQVVVESLDLPFDEFKVKAQELAETFKTPEPQKVEEPKQVVVTESTVVVEKPQSEVKTEETIPADVAWVLQALRRNQE